MALVVAQDYLGVGAAPKRFARGLEFPVQVLEVVDLAIEDNVAGAIVGRHRLMSGGAQVDDAEPVEAEPDLHPMAGGGRVHLKGAGRAISQRSQDEALIVGAPVALDASGACQAGGGNWPAIEIHCRNKSAHSSTNPIQSPPRMSIARWRQQFAAPRKPARRSHSQSRGRLALEDVLAAAGTPVPLDYAVSRAEGLRARRAASGGPRSAPRRFV